MIDSPDYHGLQGLQYWTLNNKQQNALNYLKVEETFF